MPRYYDTDDWNHTLSPCPRLALGESATAFIQACRRRHGSTVADQAEAILVRGEAIECQNINALAFILGVAMEREQWVLALDIGAYLDRLSY